MQIKRFISALVWNKPPRQLDLPYQVYPRDRQHEIPAQNVIPTDYRRKFRFMDYRFVLEADHETVKEHVGLTWPIKFGSYCSSNYYCFGWPDA